MKKYFPPMIIIAYIVSLFLPYASGILVETYQLATIPGIPSLKNHQLVVSIPIASLLTCQWRDKQSSVADDVLLVLVGVILLCPYLILSIGVFGESLAVELRLIRDTLATSLMIGYYLSVLSTFMGYFWLIKKHRK